MSQIFFTIIIIVANIIRGPLSVILIILKNLSRPLNTRILFERKNLVEDTSRSFLRDGLQADYCFEVSSEGELEQVRPVIECFLSEKKRIEILFASPSVESKCLKLAVEHIELIRVLRVPIASFFPFDFLFFQSPWQWVSAPKIIFCRYDFFPELLSFKFFGKKLILLSAATKRPSWFKSQCHAFFDVIVAANKTEELLFRKNPKLKKIFSFDFRVPRIFERINAAPKTLDGILDIKDYLSFLKSLAPGDKLIMGSAWVSDLTILQSAELASLVSSGRLHILVVPHNLSSTSIESIKKKLNELMPKVPVFEISKSVNEFSGLPGIVLLNRSGILCELYSLFSFSYVGGGYERSIHSVLEPFLSGSQVFVGREINRSTEYDFIKELTPNEIHLLNNPESFYNLFKEVRLTESSKRIRLELEQSATIEMKAIMKEIQSC